jgi:aminoglycoside phosphotransferase family enzyme
MTDMALDSLDIAALQRGLQRSFPPQPVTLIETHVSWVLLCGEFAYKLKKPVNFGFLDFRTAEARRHACEEEVRLNRRTAPTLYLDVVPVCGTLREPQLGGGGPVIDHAVLMRRFPDGSLCSERLAAGTLSAEQVERLARHVGQFHLEAPLADAASRMARRRPSKPRPPPSWPMPRCSTARGAHSTASSSIPHCAGST